MNTTTKPRTFDITPNNNISFPIETILTVQKYYDHLSLSEIFGKHKSRGRDINSLIKALLSYKLTLKPERDKGCGLDQSRRGFEYIGS